MQEPPYGPWSILNQAENAGLFLLAFKGYLRVETEYRNRKSILKLINDEVVIDMDGNILDPESFILFGDWANRGVSKLLPRFIDIDDKN